MEQTLENQPIYKANNKRNVLIGILVLSVASNFAQWLAVVSEPLYSAVSILTAIGYTVGTLIWCHIDAQERNINLGPGFRILLIVLGPIALIYYLFKSRGFFRGFISLGWMTAFFVLILLLNMITSLILALISDRLGLFKQ